MSTDVKGNVSLAPGEKPARAGIVAALLSIGGVIGVANVTARGQLVTAMNDAGIGPSAAKPLVVVRADAVNGRQIEYTTDGVNWFPGTPHVYAERTGTSQTSANATLVAVTGVSVSLPLGNAGEVRVSGGLPSFSTSTADVLVISLKVDGVVAREWTRAANSSPSTAATSNAQNFEAVLTGLSAGPHTFELFFARAAGGGTITVSPSATTPAWLSAQAIV